MDKINTNPTPKKQKKINRQTYWGYKILDWAWGRANVKTYRGFCPLFWSIWLTLLLSPMIIFGKTFEFVWGIIKDLGKNSKDSAPTKEKISISKPADYLIVRVFEEIRDNYENWKEKRNGRAESDEEDFIYRLYYDTEMSGRERDWFLNTPNWKSLYSEIKQKIEEQKIREAARKIAREKMQAKIDIIVSKTSWMVKPGICISAVVAAWYLYQIVFYVFSHLLGWIQEIFTFELLKNLGMAALLLVAAVLIVGFLAKLFQIIKEKLNSIPDSPKVKEIQQDFILTRFLRVFGSFVIESFCFVRDTVKMLYKKECPLISYGEENGPIEKNVKAETEIEAKSRFFDGNP